MRFLQLGFFSGRDQVLSRFSPSLAGIFWLVILLSGATTAFGKNIDSLENITPGLPAGEEKAKNLIAIGDHYLRADFEKSIQALKEAVEISEKIHFVEGLTMAYNSLTILHTEYGAYQVAMEYGEKLQEYAAESKNEFRIANAHINVGNIFLYLDDLPKAKYYYELAQPYYLKSENYSGLGIVKLNLGGIFLARDEFDSARVYFHAANAFFLKMKNRNPYLEAASALNLGTIAQRLENWDEALRYFSLGDSLSREAGDSIQLSRNHLNFARIYAEQGKFDLAEASYQKACLIAEKSPAPKIEIEKWMTTSLIAEKKGDFETALVDYKRYSKLQDSLAGQEALENVSRLQIVFDAERKNTEITLLQKDARNKQLLLYLFAGGMLLVLVFAGSLVRNTRKQRQLMEQLKRANQSLEEKAAEITAQMEVEESLNRERNGLIQIVAHDLKAPINNTLSLIAMLQQTREKAEMQDQIIQKIRKVNIGAQNLINDLMYLNPEAAGVGGEQEQSVDLTKILGEQVEAFQEQAHQKNIQLHFSSAVPTLSLNTQPGAWRRITDNLVSNALKFSHPHTQVSIRLFTDEGKAILEVEDQGQGIRKEDFGKVFHKFARLEARPTGGEGSTGLGLSIVKALVANLGGEISFESEWGKGTTFRVSVPISA